MEIIDWHAALTAGVVDDKVGIRMTKLTQNGSFVTYLTMLEAGCAITAHYHQHGDEHYHLLGGQGCISIRGIDHAQGEEIIVPACHSFQIPQNTWHSLKNTGHTPLILMFSCPPSHLDSDRHF